MATPNGRGGWDLTDADVTAIAAASGFDVERDTNEVECSAPEAPMAGTGRVKHVTGWGDQPIKMVEKVAQPASWDAHDATVDAALRAQQLRPVPPWSAEYKLRNALGRPALAKRIVDALPQPLAVELADVLWIILETRVKEEVAAVSAAVERAVKQKIDWLESQTNRKREELTHERFGRTTRLD